MLGSTVLFSEIGFLTVSRNETKTERYWTRKKGYFFLDNCFFHPSEDELISADGKTTAKCLSPNVTTFLQPMEQGVFKSIKRIYRKSIMRDLVSQSTFTIQDFLKRIDKIKIVDTVASA